MRILHIINSLATGGAEKLILETLPLFSQHGISCDLALLDGQDYPFKKKLQEDTTTKVIELSKMKTAVYNPIFIFKLIPLLKKYDVIHVHLFPAQYFAVLAKVLSFSKVKLIFTEHSTNNRRLANPKLKSIERFIYGHYALIICITEQVKRALKDKLALSNQQLKVVQNGINLEEINRSKALSRDLLSYQTDDYLLIMVAGFRKEKDQDTVIRALKNLPANFKLLLVGEGERRMELNSLVSELKIENRVHFLGVRTDVYQLVKMADLAILSSHWEGFGLAAAEAMACGTPVLASNVDGLAQVVEGGGKLFEKGNEEELSEAVLNLASDKTLYNQYKAMGIEKSKQYDIQLMIKHTVLLYKNVING